MRVWGEDAALLAAGGVDLAALRALEAGIAASLRLPRGPYQDVHVHLGTDADGHRLEAGALLSDMDRWGVARSVCFPADEPGPGGDFAQANAAVLRAAAEHPGRIVPFCRADPSRGAAQAIARAAAAGARGLKLHPVAQRFALDSAEAAACVAAATERGWPVVVHAGFGARGLAGPLRRLLDAVPGARLVLAHAARGDARAVLAAVGRHPGVWWDTSLAILPDLVMLPPDRLLFGTDRPYGEHATALCLVDRAARLAGWDATAVAGILGGNLSRLLEGCG